MSHAGEVTVREVTVPATVDDRDLRASVDILNVTTAEVVGHSELANTYAETLRQWQPTAYHTVFRALAEVDAVPVGRGYVGLPLAEAPDTAYVNIWVLPMYRRLGVGTALLRWIDDITDADGRSCHQAWSLSPDLNGGTHTARTGFGGVAAHAPGTRFALGAGFDLLQVERMSRLDLPGSADHVRDVLAEAQRTASPEYRTVAWRGYTPDDRLDDVAWMCSRMSTDAPHGDLQVDAQVWDADRVRATEERLASDDRYLLTAAAEHIRTGQLVAYTTLTVPTEGGRVARQEDTLVTAEHRGRRLGALVKAANLVQLREQAHEVPAVYTWNAEENRPMLDVNDALGFEGVGFEGQWERTRASAG